jgi:hypothetical protein
MKKNASAGKGRRAAAARTRTAGSKPVTSARKARASVKRPGRSRRATRRKRGSQMETDYAIAMHKAVLRNLQRWVKGLDGPARNRPIVATASGETVTPNALVEQVQKRTPFGREYVLSVNRLALNHVMLKGRESRGKHEPK